MAERTTEAEKERSRLPVDPKSVMAMSAYVWQRFTADQGLRVAASLSYTSLLAIVPLMAIAFGVLAAFPAFEGVRGAIEDALFDNMLPETAFTVQDYLGKFVSNTGTLSTVGILGLALTAILLFATIEDAFNRIFRVTSGRPLVPKLLMYWAMITLGPMLLGASFTLSTYMFTVTKLAGLDQFTGVFGNLALAVPTLIFMAMAVMFYMVIPYRPVNFRAALIGGIVTGLLFALLRKMFGLYIANVPTYQNIYGAVAAVPVFLVWMYLTWTIVILGGVLTASISEWRTAGGRPPDDELRPGPRMVIALRILALLLNSHQKGEGLSRGQILRGVGRGEAAVEKVLHMLKEGKFLNRTERRRWIITRDLTTATLYDLYQALHLALRDEDIIVEGEGWMVGLRERLAELKQAQRTATDVTLRQILEGVAEAPAEKKTAALRPVP